VPRKREKKKRKNKAGRRETNGREGMPSKTRKDAGPGQKKGGEMQGPRTRRLNEIP